MQRLQGMADEIKAMMGALGAAKKGGDNGSNFEGGQGEEDEEEEQLYVNIGTIIIKGRKLIPIYVYFKNICLHLTPTSNILILNM